MGSFGNKEMHETERTRDLEYHEDEYLVIAGNGFILLACLMREFDAPKDVKENNDEVMLYSSQKKLTQRIREVITTEIPKDEHGQSKVLLLW